MISLPSNAVLLLIDVQQAFNDAAWGERNNPDAEKKIASLLAAWRERSMPVFHVHHINPKSTSLFNPASVGSVVKEEARPLPGEPVFVKSVNSAFIGTDLEAQLRANRITTLVIVGITTDHCVSTTARMAGNLGFSTYVVSDATATFERIGPGGRHWSAEIMHDTALASLHEEFATIVSEAEVLENLALFAKSASVKSHVTDEQIEERAHA